MYLKSKFDGTLVSITDIMWLIIDTGFNTHNLAKYKMKYDLTNRQMKRLVRDIKQYYRDEEEKWHDIDYDPEW